MNLKSILFLLSVAAIAYGVFYRDMPGQQYGAAAGNAGVAVADSERPFSPPWRDANESAADRAFAVHGRNVPVEGKGIVVKVLRDDDEGSRHQKFLLRLPSGLTILIAHNIDLAPRLEPLHAGDSVSFRGEYEWNEKGGVVHWTHRDPSGRHVAGWLRRDGTTVQ